MEIEFLQKLEFLFKPASLKVAYGGRGGGKTEGFAQALIILAQTKKLRILCCREFHKSMKESVYQTLVGQINNMDLSKEFDSQKQALYAVDKSIVAYNELRPHMSCDYMTHIAAHNLKGVLKKKWKNKSYLSSANR